MLIETDYRALLSAGQGGLPQNIAGGVVVIGNFDGVHLGHRALLAQAKEVADKNNKPLVVLTFHPHPRLYFAPNQPSFLISMPEQKNRLLVEAGADFVVSVKFDSELANAEATDFIQYVLIHALQAHTVLVGENFVFGKERSGDVAMLRQWGQSKGFQTGIVGLAEEGAVRVSSERVRNALRDGHLDQANMLLGRSWQIIGRVIPGHQRGRTIGFPTANISLGEYVQPALGAYAAKVTLLDDGSTYNAVVNIGKRPTIGDFNPILEAHLFDYSGDLYKRELAVDFMQFIRAERKFDDIDALKAQIAKDVAQAKSLFDLS